MTVNFEFKNLRASTKEWASAYHVDCDVYVGEDFITTYTYNPWWLLEGACKKPRDYEKYHKQSEICFKNGELKETKITIEEYPETAKLFFGQHFAFGKKLREETVKRIRDEILKDLKGKFPAEIQPERADVIDCLMLDSDALDYSFQDWCDNCGYDSDSISALETYNECCKIGRKLMKMGIYNALKEEWEKNNE